MKTKKEFAALQLELSKALDEVERLSALVEESTPEETDAEKITRLEAALAVKESEAEAKKAKAAIYTPKDRTDAQKASIIKKAKSLGI